MYIDDELLDPMTFTGYTYLNCAPPVIKEHVK